MIKQSFDAPRVAKDWVTVAKSIEFKEKVENIGASLSKHIMSAIKDVAGGWPNFDSPLICTLYTSKS